MTDTIPIEWQESLKPGLQAAYLAQRPAFMQDKTGKLRPRGRDEAFQFVLGYILAWHYAKGLFPNQSPSVFLLQVRGADEVAGLDEHGVPKP